MYYKVFNEIENQVIGVGTSANLCGYSEKTNRLVHTSESLAQYICVNDLIYRIEMLNREHPSQKGKYPIAQMSIITKDEYEKLSSNL